MSKLMALLGRFLFETHDAVRLRMQQDDTSDLEIALDIPYMDDGDAGHLFDIYRPKGAAADIPVIVNIHGGGLFASYKTVNALFNHEWARMGYAVVSLSYRRIPDTTLIHQIEDVMTALRFLNENKGRYGLNLDTCCLTGDSAPSPKYGCGAGMVRTEVRMPASSMNCRCASAFQEGMGKPSSISIPCAFTASR